MKVNNKSAQGLMNDRAISDLAKDPGIKRGKAQSATPSEMMDATRLQLSPQARQINKAKEIASQDSVDEAKIARLQNMIDSGEYKVDAEAVADKLVNEHLLLPS
ncbi:flagellar biosynthesis anti-sigma factor FlgM [bacterium]|nr:flagellar biosynthesis anti-sigma factor FlgM [bacterium]